MYWWFLWYKLHADHFTSTSESAEQGDSNAQNSLGCLYGDGRGTEKDLQKAFYWFQKAAENGNEVAQSNLGECYELGDGVEKDEVKAFEWYKNQLKMDI